MSFAHVVGHSRPLAILRRALASARVAHAYLFAGPDGVGKATVAREFSKALLCGVLAEDSCDQCNACRKVSDRNHPDAVTIEPEGTQIVVGQVREMQRSMVYRPLEGRWRAFILDQAHDLNPQAANALLKALEEPPDGNVLILVARSTASLLPTLVSRCQVVHFSPLSISEVARYLQERGGWDVEAAQRAAVHSQGSIGKALSLKEDPLPGLAAEVAGFLGEVAGLRSAQILERADAWAGGRKEVLLRLEFLQGVFRDLVFLRLGREDVDRQELKEPLRAMAALWSLSQLVRGWEGVNAAIRGVERNWNPHLVMEELLFGMWEMKGGERT